MAHSKEDMSHAEMKRRGHSDHAEQIRHHTSHADEAEDRAMIAKAVHQHEKKDHPGTKETHLKFRDGGAVPGKPRKEHLGRAKHAKGGSVKGKGNHVNVIIAGGHPGGMPGPTPGPVGGVAPPPMPMAPPRPPMGPMAGPPVGAGVPGMGGPPGMRARGGRAYAKGGMVDMDAGAGGGLGRLEKIKDYGKKAPAGENSSDAAMGTENKSFSEDTENKNKTGNSKSGRT